MAVRRVWHVCGPRGGLGGALVLGFVILLATVGPKPALLVEIYPIETCCYPIERPVVSRTPPSSKSNLI
eukprot:203335-Amorphochlora_amoeboformis.AAC.2